MKSDVFGITMSTLPFKSLGSVQVLFIYFIIIFFLLRNQILLFSKDSLN